VLPVSTEQLAVLRLGNVDWSDLGTPERVMFALARSGLDGVNSENLKGFRCQTVTREGRLKIASGWYWCRESPSLD
jgi:hypothetical protein